MPWLLAFLGVWCFGAGLVSGGDVVPSEKGPIATHSGSLFRNWLLTGTAPRGGNIGIDPRFANHQIYLTLFQGGLTPIRWGSRRPEVKATLQRCVDQIRGHERFPQFSVNDPARCRILIEIVTKRTEVKSREIQDRRFGPNRFEPGITGIRFLYRGQVYYYMPTEAFTRSHLNLNQVLNYLVRRTGIASEIDLKNERQKALLDRIQGVELIESVSAVTFGGRFLPLYRGRPAPRPMSVARLESMVRSSLDWLLREAKPDGSFLYYYDGTTGSEVDFNHPRNPEYYNILRHCGGIVALVEGYELTSDSKYLVAARRAIDFFITHLHTRGYGDGAAHYAYNNKKAKLGGTGIGLVALCRYFAHRRDSDLAPYMHGMANHLISQVGQDGEMLGYYRHPAIHDGQPLHAGRLTPRQRKQLFSFYYPGEALLGLAFYVGAFRLETEREALIKSLAAKAIHYLVELRPLRHPEMFRSLPSDAWLMQAISVWYEYPDMRRREWSSFVRSDVDQLIRQMYGPEESPYRDYPGCFYYLFGDHAYPDGARAEGLYAAYELARKEGESTRASKYLSAMKAVASSLMWTYNSETSTYACREPSRAAGAFRFKLTRQWIRVDSIQHTACFLRDS